MPELIEKSGSDLGQPPESQAALRALVAEVRGQHASILALFREASEIELLSPDQADAFLVEADRRLRKHFRSERAMQIALGAADLNAEHRKSHEDFLSALKKTRETLHEPYALAQTPRQAIALLAYWFMNHTLYVDRWLERDAQKVLGLVDPSQGQSILGIEEDALALHEILVHNGLDFMHIYDYTMQEIHGRGQAHRQIESIRKINACIARLHMTAHEAHDVAHFLGEAQSIVQQYTGLSRCRLVYMDHFYRLADTQPQPRPGEVAPQPEEALALDGLSDVDRSFYESMMDDWRAMDRRFSESDGDDPIESQRWVRLHQDARGVNTPIRRGDFIWGALTVQDEHQNFDDALNMAIFDLAQSISQCLDQIDLKSRQGQLSRMRESLLDNALAGILMTSGDIVVEANRRFADMMGHEQHHDLIGLSTHMFFDGEDEFRKVRDLYPTVYLQGHAQCASVRLRTRSGKILSCDLAGKYDSNIQPSMVVWTIVDVTERDAFKSSIEHAAFHDPLTGLPNRRAMDNEIARALERSRRTGSCLAIGMIDLDDFKQVNDTLGHQAGDELLRQLADRLRTLMRKTDFLARLGGDELMVLIEDIDAERDLDQLDKAFSRIHRAVEKPFQIEGGQQARVEMTMGVSVYPMDGEDINDLIRKADTAMYQCKLERDRRQSWWRMPQSINMFLHKQSLISAYDTRAINILRRAESFVEAAHARFADMVKEARQADQTQDEASCESHSECDVYALWSKSQLEYFRFILDPARSVQAIRERTKESGRFHAMAGISPAWISRSMSEFRSLLNEMLSSSHLSPKDRYMAFQIAEIRMQEALQSDLEGQDEVHKKYLEFLSQPMPERGMLWVDIRAREVRDLAQLPGVCAVTVMHLNKSGTFLMEDSSGRCARDLSKLLQSPGFEVLLNAEDERSHSISVATWKSRAIQRSCNVREDERLKHWMDALPEDLPVRSVLSIPVSGADGRMDFVLNVFGSHLYQFESSLMRQFGQGLQQRWNQLRSYAYPQRPTGIAQVAAMQIRDALFSGGLRMYVQPVVDVVQHKIYSVEALARLQMDDGRILNPGQFLPILGEEDLEHLFVLSLRQALDHLCEADQWGRPLRVAVNLPPHALLDPRLTHWVSENLRSRSIDSSRLCLELLENTEVDVKAARQAMDDLRNLGVNLAIDDLGSGYSSLQRMASMPLNLIKVDQGIVRRIEESPRQVLSMIDTFIRMGRDLRLDVIVEGIENQGMMEVARIMGAQYLQGYHLARPMPFSNFRPWAEEFDRDAAHRCDASNVSTMIGAIALCWKVLRYPSARPRFNAARDKVVAFLRREGFSELAGQAHDLAMEQSSGADDLIQAMLDVLGMRTTEESSLNDAVAS